MPYSNYMQDRMGSAELAGAEILEAGALCTLTLTYTAGQFGIDDTGSIKIVHRFASDMGVPQFSEPEALNYTTVEASNGAVLAVRWDPKMNLRPWDKTLYIKVVRGYLREGDQLVVRYGDQRQGSPGLRMQTFCESSFEFRVLVDAFATCDYVPLPQSPELPILPGSPVRLMAVAPTRVDAGTPFRLRIKAEDLWGNPSDRQTLALRITSNVDVDGLPDELVLPAGQFSVECQGLTVAQPGIVRIRVEAADTAIAGVDVNPVAVVAEPGVYALWCDLHGQSEETIGTNTIDEYFHFARDRAFLDVGSHQGNDFQITTPMWQAFNRAFAAFDEPGRFVCIPGYEWSGNTGLGGDRNVFYRHDNRPIFRSSHALVPDLADAESDAFDANELFARLADEDCIVHAHVGGRYADVDAGHDIGIERAFEVHSAWGTFEWLLDDAFRNGFRVGIVANSDGHKGRPGASYPGASMFGSYGGLTCLLADSFDRNGVFEALRRRRHYATTGNRVVLDTFVDFERPAIEYLHDPALQNGPSSEVRRAGMGAIVRTDEDAVSFHCELQGSAPLERLQLRNGSDIVETVYPYEQQDLNRRLRLVFEGANYRGRGREVVWDGQASITGASIERTGMVNFYNPEKQVRQPKPTSLEWQAVTTGGFCAIDIWLDRWSESAELHIETPHVSITQKLGELQLADRVYTAGGLQRQVRLYRLPDTLSQTAMQLTRSMQRVDGRDNPLYINAVQENGHMVWSSPVYLI